MKKLFSMAVAAVALCGWVESAHAGDTQTTKVDSKTEVRGDKSKSTTEAVHKDDPDGLLNSKTSRSKSEKSTERLRNGHTKETTEKTEKVDGAGTHDQKRHTKHTVEKDANGNVIKEDLNKK